MIALLLLLGVVALDPQVLVLRSGTQIAIQGPVREENGLLLFRKADGALYSIARADLDDAATRQLNEASRPLVAREEPRSDERIKLRVDEARRRELIAALEKNHSGQPAPRSVLLENPPAAPSEAEVAAEEQEEWNWRNRARAHEEALRQARENRDLLIARAAQLRARIVGLLNLGFKPAQFTYDTTQLQYLTEQIPASELEVVRAERALEQFLDDARRQGVLPGWLR